MLYMITYIENNKNQQIRHLSLFLHSKMCAIAICAKCKKGLFKNPTQLNVTMKETVAKEI